MQTIIEGYAVQVESYSSESIDPVTAQPVRLELHKQKPDEHGRRSWVVYRLRSTLRTDPNGGFEYVNIPPYRDVLLADGSWASVLTQWDGPRAQYHSVAEALRVANGHC